MLLRFHLAHLAWAELDEGETIRRYMTVYLDLLSAVVKVITAVPWSESWSTFSTSPPPERFLFSKKFKIASLVVFALIPVTSMVRDSWDTPSLCGSTSGLRAVIMTFSVAPSRVCLPCLRILFVAFKVTNFNHHRTILCLEILSQILENFPYSLSADVKVMIAIPRSGVWTTSSISPPERVWSSKNFKIASLVVFAASPVTFIVRDSCIPAVSSVSAAVLVGFTSSMAPSRMCLSRSNTPFAAWNVTKCNNCLSEQGKLFQDS